MRFYDMEASWSVYEKMEAFADGYGAWRFLPHPGGLLEQPEWLMEDLLTWRWLANKVKKQQEAQKKDASDNV